MKIKANSSEAPSLRRVMYVEDEEDNWEIAMLLLKGRFNLLRARNAREACDILKANANNLHAILMDIQLSGSDLDGIQLTELIRGTTPTDKRPSYANGLTASSVPIIFMTGYGARYPEGTLLAKGGDMLMTKPVDFTKLTLALASISFRKVHTLLDPQDKA